ncbi:MAG: hypothetical protein ACJ72N_01100 [Labedaea sp.]
MAPPPEPRDSGKIDVTPDDVNAAAETFAKQQNALENAWSALSDALSRDEGMAGNDGGADKFVARYDPAAKAVWSAFGSGIRTLGGIANGLVATANNYLKAAAHSTAGKPTPRQFPPLGVYSDVMMPGPATAKGAGHSSVPDFLAKYWPNGDPDKLRDAARAWHTARDRIGDIVNALHGAVTSVTESNNTECLRAMNEFWDSLAKSGDQRALFTGLHDACGKLGDACDGYAKAIDDARHNLKVALAEIGVAVVLTSVVGILLTPFTGGGSDAAAGAADAAEVAAVAEPVIAEFETAVAADVEATIAADVAETLEVAAADAPTVEAVEAETSQVETTIEQELADAEGTPNLPEQPVAPGDQAAADILEPGGRPIGEPGTSPSIRTMSEQELDQVWNDVVEKYGPPKEIQTPKGNIEYVETPDGGRIQLRDFSKSGGKTIDINIDGVSVDKIHIK